MEREKEGQKGAQSPVCLRRLGPWTLTGGKRESERERCKSKALGPMDSDGGQESERERCESKALGPMDSDGGARERARETRVLLHAMCV